MTPNQPEKDSFRISPLKWIELGIYLLAIVAGVLYLYTDILPLPFLIAVFALALIAGSVLRIIDLRKENDKNPLRYMVPGILLVLAGALIIYGFFA